MNFLSIIPRTMRMVHHASLLWRASASGWEKSVDEVHIRAAVGWLIEAQKACNGQGYAHSFHLCDGWKPAYPETTGYIIPTLHHAHVRYGISGLQESIAAAARWLHSIQQEDGSFLDLLGRPQVFDTGQILIGFNYLAEHAPKFVERERIARAARWLCTVQEPDGSFVRHAYNGIPHSYYSRVGAALMTAGRLTGDETLREAGLRNLRWTLMQQMTNGFFQNLSFDSSPPYLHTMIYVIEGLLDAYGETGESSFLAAAISFADQLLLIATDRDRILRSQYNPDFTVANSEKCLVGLAQWAGVCFRLAKIRKDSAYLSEGIKTVDFLKSRQIRSGDCRLNGALMGSDPSWGRYMRLAAPNWGVKFFLDALLVKENVTGMNVR